MSSKSEKKLYLDYSVQSQKLMAKLVESLMECLTQAPDYVTLETCREMFMLNNNNSLPKYNDCKCAGICIGREMGIVDEQGNGRLDKLKDDTSGANAEKWFREIDMIMESCKHIIINDCELAYDWAFCAVNNSKMTRDWIRSFIPDFMKTNEK